MTTPVASRHWVPNSDGTVDGRYPNGDKPPASPQIVWATIGYPVINTLVINHAYSEEMRAAHLTGTDAGTATLSIVQVSGDNYATENWAMTGDNLTHPSNSDQGAGVFKHRATSGAVTADSPNRSWAYLPPPEIQIKWNPGIYVVPQTTANNITTAVLDELAAMPNVVGVSAYIDWSQIELTRGVYDLGLGSVFKTIYDKCVARDLRLRVSVRNYGGASRYPAYLATESGAAGGWYVPASGSTRLKYHNSVLMDRWLAMMAGFGAAADSLPWFEGITNGDSIVAQGAEPSDYSETNYITQYKRWMAAASTHFPTSNVWICFDYGFSQANYPDLMAYAYAHRCGIAGPDCICDHGNVDASTNGGRTFAGKLWNGAAWVTGGVIYRGLMANSTEGQNAEYGGKENAGSNLPWTLDEILTHVVSYNGQQHYPISYKNTTATPTPPLDIYWDNTKAYATNPTPLCSDMKTWINAGGHAVYPGFPSNYPAVITGGT